MSWYMRYADHPQETGCQSDDISLEYNSIDSVLQYGTG